MMRATSTRFIRLLLTVLALIAAPDLARAQVDLSGGWQTRLDEDNGERTNVQGPNIGEYQGLPFNDAGRARAESWDPNVANVPEHQCIPHPADYGPNFSNLKIWNEVDPATGTILAYHTQMVWMAPVRTIWMDGRPHPSPRAPHTWQGFSTGRWKGEVLEITTTHLKTGYLRRNGSMRSDEAVLYERIARVGNVLTWISIVDDPAYLTEPLIRSRNFAYDPAVDPGAYPCSVEIEVPGDQTKIPHFLPGANPYLNDFAARFQIPEEARRGGAETMYPEYLERLRTLPGAVPQNPSPDAVRNR